MKKVYLGSNSPRRLQLLQQIGLEVEILKFEIDERIAPQESAVQYVVRMALEKNQQARLLLQEKNELHQHTMPIITADTCIAYQQQILGKPIDVAHARTMLQQLSGNTHQVLSAVAVHYRNQTEYKLQISDVTFHTLSIQEIDNYLASKESFDKAGSYAIQGLAATFIRHISGSYSGIMGLPLFETNQILNALNFFDNYSHLASK